MSNHSYYIPSQEEIRKRCVTIRSERSPDVKVPPHFFDFIKLYVKFSELIQEKAKNDGMPVDKMMDDEIRFVFYLINRSLGSAENFHCADCEKINDGFSKLCQKCSYKKQVHRKMRKMELDESKVRDD